MNKLEKKVVLLTGGTKGIGLGIVETFLTHKMKVAFTGRNQADVEKNVLHLKEKFGAEASVIGLRADVRKYEDMERVSDQIVTHFGKIDIVIANAGIGYFAPIDEMPVDKWKEVIDTNLTGVFYTIRSTVDQLIQQQGYFITISSLAGVNFFEGGSAYNASKFGVTGFTQAVMLDLRKKGVKTTTILPGSVTSYFNDHIPNETDTWKIQPEDLGQLLVDLLQMERRVLPSKVEIRPSFPK